MSPLEHLDVVQQGATNSLRYCMLKTCSAVEECKGSSQWGTIILATDHWEASMLWQWYQDENLNNYITVASFLPFLSDVLFLVLFLSVPKLVFFKMLIRVKFQQVGYF